ncbi:hypothetical protein PspLS_01158 [Pyricularia sp. CBS 133598]|nr:hypothetical protein PspLS_01158 [Pyricularia sp. CBS 133598]
MNQSEDQLGTSRLQAIFLAAPGLEVSKIARLNCFLSSNKRTNLRELTLSSSCLDIHVLKLLLQDCFVLESFAYEMEFDPEYHLDSPDTYPRDLVRAISEHASETLRSLNLNFWHFWSGWYLDEPAEGMGSFQSLKSLEHLEVSLESLLGRTFTENGKENVLRLLSCTLPSRIHSVTIEVSCEEDTRLLGLTLDYFTKVRRKAFPELEIIVIRGTYSELQLAAVSQLISSFGESGVSLILRHEPVTAYQSTSNQAPVLEES